MLASVTRFSCIQGADLKKLVKEEKMKQVINIGNHFEDVKN